MNRNRAKYEKATAEAISKLLININKKLYAKAKNYANDLDGLKEIVEAELINLTNDVGLEVSERLYKFSENLYTDKAFKIRKGYKFGREDREFLNTMENINYNFFVDYTTEKADALRQAILDIRSNPELTTKEIQEQLAQSFGAQSKRDIAYTKTLLATNGTWAASIGATNAMSSLGVTKYQYFAILDNVTTDFCRHINGKTNEVKNAVALAEGFKTTGNMSAEDAKSWFKINSPMITETSDGVFQTAGIIGAQEYNLDSIMDIPGIALPPFHYNCRTEIIRV